MNLLVLGLLQAAAQPQGMNPVRWGMLLVSICLLIVGWMVWRLADRANGALGTSWVRATHRAIGAYHLIAGVMLVASVVSPITGWKWVATLLWTFVILFIGATPFYAGCWKVAVDKWTAVVKGSEHL